MLILWGSDTFIVSDQDSKVLSLFVSLLEKIKETKKKRIKKINVTQQKGKKSQIKEASPPSKLVLFFFFLCLRAFLFFISS